MIATRLFFISSAIFISLVFISFGRKMPEESFKSTVETMGKVFAVFLVAGFILFILGI